MIRRTNVSERVTLLNTTSLLFRYFGSILALLSQLITKKLFVFIIIYALINNWVVFLYFINCCIFSVYYQRNKLRQARRWQRKTSQATWDVFLWISRNCRHVLFPQPCHAMHHGTGHARQDPRPRKSLSSGGIMDLRG